MAGHRSVLVVALIGCILCLPGRAEGQLIEESNGETLRAPSPQADEQHRPDLEQTAELIVEQVNQFRREQGLRPVEANRELTETARYFARYMAERDVLSHTADDKRPAQRAEERGYEFCIVTENIAYQYRSQGFRTEELADQFVQGWQDSPDHRRSMLDADVTETGAAVARSDDTGYYYGVQMFGRPQKDSIRFEIRNESDTTVEYEIGERRWSLPPRYTRTHERCRPRDVVFRWPEDEDEVRSQTVTPRSGDRFTVRREQGRFQVRQQ